MVEDTPPNPHWQAMEYVKVKFPVGGMGALPVPTPPLTTTDKGPGVGEVMARYEAVEDAQVGDGPELTPTTPTPPMSPGQSPNAMQPPSKAAMWVEREPLKGSFVTALHVSSATEAVLGGMVRRKAVWAGDGREVENVPPVATGRVSPGF